MRGKKIFRSPFTLKKETALEKMRDKREIGIELYKYRLYIPDLTHFHPCDGSAGELN